MNSRETIIYVTREIERALGMTPNPNYIVVSNRTPYGEEVKKQHPDSVILIEAGAHENADAEGLIGTGDLLTRPETAELISQITEKTGNRPYLLVFKNTARIEPLARARGWTLLNPQASISEKVENKITQISWLGDAGKYLPPHKIEITKNVSWSGTPFVLQWAHGHTGGGTILVQSQTDLDAIKTKFPERRCRLTNFISGPSFTLNVVVTPEAIIPSSPSYQITGLAPFTDGGFATIGNDWALASKILTAEDKNWIKLLVNDTGAKMQKDFWRGLYGLDIIKDEKTGNMYLIEINARQPASTTFESFLQESARMKGATGLTTLEAHIEALMGRPITKQLIPVTNGAQIVQRVTKDIQSIDEDAMGSLELAGFETIQYSNTEMNSDLLRIQSMNGLMAAHNEFNETGKQIIEALQ